MPRNHEIEAALEYHERTKHSLASVQSNRHYLDWDNQPLPFKIIRDVPAFPLPRESPAPAPASLSAIETLTSRGNEGARGPDLASLSRLLGLSAGITRTRTLAGGQRYYFRAAACTGALYHIDLYVICADLDGVPAGVYQFGPHDFALHQLRAGDCRVAVVEASGDEPALAQAPAILALASTYWRNSWKYQARAYRHCFWDSGTILANFFAVAADEQIRARLVCGFVDQQIERLLGLDPEREGALALVALGGVGDTSSPAGELSPLSLTTEPLSRSEISYPAILAMHDASRLRSPAEVREWRSGAGPPSAKPASTPPLPREHYLRTGEGQGGGFEMTSAEETATDEGIASVIRRRGSSRSFTHAPIELAQLSLLLQSAAAPVPSDFGTAGNQAYVIANAVESLAPGKYVRENGELTLLQGGDFRREAGYLGLGQELPADAAADIYFLCDLDPVLERFGNRGYRVAQLEAAIAAGKMYLAAYALRLGATGLTFFDDDVTRFFSPHAAGKSVMFLLAAGHGNRRNRSE